MLRILYFCGAMLFACGPASAGVAEDCAHEQDLDRKIAACSTSIQQNPRVGAAYNNRGNAYSGKGEYDHAIADYDRAIELDPKNVTAYINRGFAYKQKGEYDRAIADETRTIELDPKIRISLLQSRRGLPQ